MIGTSNLSTPTQMKP